MSSNTTIKFPSIQKLMQWGTILIGCSVPISVVADNVWLAFVLFGALFSTPAISRIAIAHPVARAALMLFTALLLAMLYGETPLKEAVNILMKYIDLMFVPLFIFALATPASQHRARLAFFIAMSVTLVLSYAVGLKILPVMAWMNIFTEPGNPVIFHSHITQNNLMAFAIFLALLEWRDTVAPVKKMIWGSFALLASINLLFMVQGRTGYLVLLILLAWFAWTSVRRFMLNRGKNWGWQQGLLLITGLCIVALTAYFTSQRLHDRVAMVAAEYQAWTPNHGHDTSTGQRLDFYSNSLQIVREHWLLGVGTGGFPAAFEKQVAGTEVLRTHNAHNEYLMISVQTGLVGLGLMLYLFYTQWRLAPLLPSAFEQDAARGLVLAYLVNCLFNSALHDHADGLFFAFMTAVFFANLKLESKRE